MISIGWLFGSAIFGIIWFLTLFMVLPIGVRTQDEDGEVAPGSVASAPAVPHIWRRLGATTILAALLYSGVYWLLTSQSAVGFWYFITPDFVN